MGWDIIGGMTDVKADLVFSIQDNFRYKHLSGKHDQKLHGRWAGDPKLRIGRPHHSWSTFDKRIPEGIDPVPVTPELKAIIGGRLEYGEENHIQGWANYIEEKTGLKVLDFTNSIEVHFSVPEQPGSVLGSYNFDDYSIDLKMFEPDGKILHDSIDEREVIPAAPVFIHEVAHGIYIRCWARGNHAIQRYYDKFMEGDFDKFTQYGKTNIHESFAESFTLYLIAGGKKRNKTITPRRAEQVFRVIDQVINEHERYLRENQTANIPR